jgi:glutamate dehydrogenase
VRFAPGAAPDDEERSRRVDRVRRRFLDALSDVTLLADDRALRRMLTLLDSAVRTNYWRNGGARPTRRSGGVPYISFKFAAAGLQGIARTGLLYEVWVRSSRMEAVHLRGSNVARGGIRWSDRPDDFRTEVLGLVKTQMVKNAVIIPAGSKGGFVTLRHPAEGEEMAEEGREQYRTLIRGLLDVTDNLGADGRTLPPEDVVCHDGPDPYLVVAADKGTASFSDLANGVAAEYAFWLGDAFASGGSNGYDHKQVGITARGAWECVKLHFRERGKDIQAEPFTVVGIGDMSGDVFGNGMLLSRQIRLLAAFDHRHVFIDPDPDPEASFVERERLFALGRSSWEDYDRSVLSPGAMIVSRGAKEVELTPQAREVLGLAEDVGALDGERLIKAVLCAPAELLWNGGVGTYVKASTETHADAGDPANDAVRVDAPDLRCEVVGEGGNLGFTQRARVEYALAGGRLNTDALDNSAGVDMSDHEVNLKILLNPAVRDGALSEERRNALLEDVTEAVAELVLEHNRSQSLAISLDENRAREIGGEFKGLIAALEKSGNLDRASEYLPTFEQLMEREQEMGVGLTRPELCVLLAYAKLHLMKELLASDIPDDSVTESYLLGYFPPRAVMEAGQDHLWDHRLRREVVASQITNDVVDLMGATFVHRVARDTGRTPADVVRSWLVAARLAGHRALLQRMADQSKRLPAGVAYRWLLGLGRVLERTARWVLTNVPAATPTANVITASFEGLSVLRGHFGDIVAGEDRDLFNSRVAEIHETGADDEFATSLITLRFLDQLLEILRAAEETGSDPVETARVFYRISETLRIAWLRKAIFAAAGSDRWEQRAAQALSDDLTRARQRLVTHAMRAAPLGSGAEAVVESALRSQSREVARFHDLLEEIQGEDAGAGLAGLGMAVREMLALGERA